MFDVQNVGHNRILPFLPEALQGRKTFGWLRKTGKLKKKALT